MIWKSAPKAQTLPLIPAPRTSPPITGIIRRTPVPISPADVTLPIWAVTVKTYLVESCGSMKALFYLRMILSENRYPLFRIMRLSDHALRQPGRQQWKQDQNHQPDQVGDHKRQHTDKNRRHVDVLDHALDD